MLFKTEIFSEDMPYQLKDLGRSVVRVLCTDRLTVQTFSVDSVAIHVRIHKFT